MIHFSPAWHLIYTRPRQEKKVSILLSERGTQFYLPVNKVKRQWKDRQKILYEPLFPSYIFVYVTNMDEFYSSIQLEGVCGYVKLGKQIAKVSPEIISNIKLALENGSGIEVSYDPFKPGQQVVVTDGPLRGLSCEVVRDNGRQKMLVRILLLQRNIVIDMPLNFLAAAPML
ncbi:MULTISPECIES: transcription termination/antitermination protein NusG [Chitinophaga]|uniref:transcription termination/antitermination protein NusG n=1 Tax=Chitinophaga TaxID=79328 RepID=UPI000DB924F6|nr:UpxY family transcription antiterminator [Chitinophaga ginsengisegetis]MDR6571328.1 transcription antitermination factor NusG [Chitinophaga ginsengisegetis]MDR6651062.1 transcription antitermination factor NusG [Chitinophaga ginsengisegetis]MDR6657411.1 transcription antitermination factor NusG [Chitinophaga ginsengisegetis]